MKKDYLYASLLVAVIILSSLSKGYSQSKPFEPVSPEEMAKLRAAVEANPNDLDVHKAYLAAFASADEAKDQYQQWMKKYPGSAAIPLALAEKYSAYSPNSRQYLLKAAELQPNNPEIWQKLALDASLRGDDAKRQEYTQKAAAADPKNIGLQYSYINLFREGDEKAWKKRILELAKKYPTDEATASALHMMGYNMRNINERIAIWEQLRGMFPKGGLSTYHVAMSRLGDAYIQTGQYAKAIELSEAMIANKAAGRMNFSRKLQLAKRLLEIEEKMKKGEYAEARKMLGSVSTFQENLFDIGSRVILVKAAVLDAAGSTQVAYDSLMIFQARTPDVKVKEALKNYGRKLNKSKDEIRRELRAVIAQNSKPAPSFEMDQYMSDKKVKLEDLKGKVVLMSFWYPGCGPCRAEMPHMEEAIKNIDKSKLVYLGVNGVRDQDGFVLPFLKGTQYSFTPLGGTQAVKDAYKVQVYPTNYLIDAEGRIAYSRFTVNAANEQMLELMIESLLDSK